MRIGITGAFGFLGASFVADLLAEEGYSATGGQRPLAFASKTRNNPLFDPSAVEIMELDLLGEEDLAGKFAGLDAVAHFAGAVDVSLVRSQKAWEVNVIGTKRVFDAALRAKVGRLLYVSSVNVLGEATEDSLVDEASLPYGNPRYPISFASPGETLAAVESSLNGDYSFLSRMKSAYFDSKLAGWEMAKVYARDHGLPVITIFPGTALGPGDLHYGISSLIDSVWEGRLPLCLPGTASFVSSRDFARGACLALEKGGIGEAYVISGRDEDNLCYRDFIRLVSRVAREGGGRGVKRSWTLPRLATLALAAAAEGIAPSLGLSTAVVRSGWVRNACSSAKAMRELGYRPRADLGTDIKLCRDFAKRFPQGRGN